MDDALPVPISPLSQWRRVGFSPPESRESARTQPRNGGLKRHPTSESRVTDASPIHRAPTTIGPFMWERAMRAKSRAWPAPTEERVTSWRRVGFSPPESGESARPQPRNGGLKHHPTSESQGSRRLTHPPCINHDWPAPTVARANIRVYPALQPGTLAKLAQPLPAEVDEQLRRFGELAAFQACCHQA